MSKLEKLIEELCPDGVEYKKIEEVCVINRGVVISKDDIRNNPGEYPVYSSQTENNGELGKISTYAYYGEYLTWTTDGANAGSVFYRLGKFNVTNVCGLLKIKDDTVLAKYLYYILTVTAPRYVNSGMGNPKLMSNVMANIEIQIPPLPVQREIVRILDSFTEFKTELVEKLTLEISQRKKQKQYYLDQFFILPDVKDEELGEIGKFVRGSGLPKSDFTEIGVPCIHYGEIYTHYGSFTSITKSFVSPEKAEKLKKVQPNDLIIACTSENVEDICKGVAWLGSDEIVTGGHTVIFKHNENSKYLSYYLQTTQFDIDKRKYIQGTKVKDISSKNLSKITIPIPRKEKQQEIVENIDEVIFLFDELITDLQEEIKMREQQYEKYRDDIFEKIRETEVNK